MELTELPESSLKTEVKVQMILLTSTISGYAFYSKNHRLR